MSESKICSVTQLPLLSQHLLQNFPSQLKLSHQDQFPHLLPFTGQPSLAHTNLALKSL